MCFHFKLGNIYLPQRLCLAKVRSGAHAIDIIARWQVGGSWVVGFSVVGDGKGLLRGGAYKTIVGINLTTLARALGLNEPPRVCERSISSTRSFAINPLKRRHHRRVNSSVLLWLIIACGAAVGGVCVQIIHSTLRTPESGIKITSIWPSYVRVPSHTNCLGIECVVKCYFHMEQSHMKQLPCQ